MSAYLPACLLVWINEDEDDDGKMDLSSFPQVSGSLRKATLALPGFRARVEFLIIVLSRQYCRVYFYLYGVLFLMIGNKAYF